MRASCAISPSVQPTLGQSLTSIEAIRSCPQPARIAAGAALIELDLAALWADAALPTRASEEAAEYGYV